MVDHAMVGTCSAAPVSQPSSPPLATSVRDDRSQTSQRDCTRTDSS